MFILVGVVQFAVYYVIFRFLIVKLNLKTTGREESNEEVKLYTKQDYKDKVTGGQGSGDKESTSGNEALVIIEALGGKENIKK